jgi:short-subunit dehydrogenase
LEKSSSNFKPLALVTGASSGIGAEFARVLAAGGYDVLLVARREDRLRRMQEEIGGEVLAADLATDAGMEAVERRIERADNLDILVNNAGLGTKGRFWEADLRGQYAMHQVHVMATMRLTRAALPRMVARDRGAVINVSSVAAFGQSGAGSVSYSATKAWINSFTEGLALELKSVDSQVRVQALCPGFTVSEFHEAVGMDVSGIPKNLWMSAAEVVEASLRGLARDELYVIPGWRYQAWVAIQKTLPRQVIQGVARRSLKRFRKWKND